MTVERVDVGDGFERYEANVEVTLDAEDVALFNREGARGKDAWLSVRARGQRAIFPLMTAGVNGDNLETIVRGDAAAIDAALSNVGIPAAAVTMPVYVDFDGGGYRAPFAP